MNRCRGNCINTLIVLILTIAPVFLKSSYVQAVIRPQQLQLTTFVSGTFNFLVGIPSPGKRVVGFFDMPEQALMLPNPQSTKDTQESPCSPEIGLYTTETNPWAMHSDEEGLLLPKQGVLEAIYDEQTNFPARKTYFNPTIRMPQSLNLLFWDGVLNHKDWTHFLDQPNATMDPQPTPIGLLGVSIVGLATATQRNKNKGQLQADHSW